MSWNKSLDGYNRISNVVLSQAQLDGNITPHNNQLVNIGGTGGNRFGTGYFNDINLLSTGSLTGDLLSLQSQLDNIINQSITGANIIATNGDFINATINNLINSYITSSSILTNNIDTINSTIDNILTSAITSTNLLASNLTTSNLRFGNYINPLFVTEGNYGVKVNNLTVILNTKGELSTNNSNFLLSKPFLDGILPRQEPVSVGKLTEVLDLVGITIEDLSDLLGINQDILSDMQTIGLNKQDNQFKFKYSPSISDPIATKLVLNDDNTNPRRPLFFDSFGQLTTDDSLKVSDSADYNGKHVSISSVEISDANISANHLTSGNNNMINLTASSIVATNGRITNVTSTSILTTNVNATNITTTNLNASNFSISNLNTTNITASSILSGNLVLTGNITSGGKAGIFNGEFTNLCSGSLIVDQNITCNNIRVNNDINCNNLVAESPSTIASLLVPNTLNVSGSMTAASARFNNISTGLEWSGSNLQIKLNAGSGISVSGNTITNDLTDDVTTLKADMTSVKAVNTSQDATLTVHTGLIAANGVAVATALAIAGDAQTRVGYAETSIGNLNTLTNNLSTSIGSANTSIANLINNFNGSIGSLGGTTTLTTGALKVTGPSYFDGLITASNLNLLNITTANIILGSTGNLYTVINNLNTSIGNANTSISNLVTNYNNSIGSAQTSIGNLTTLTSNLSTSIGSTQTSIGNLTTLTSNLSTSIGSLNTSVSNLITNFNNSIANISLSTITTGALKVTGPSYFDGLITATNLSLLNITSSNVILGSTGNLYTVINNLNTSIGNANTSIANLITNFNNSIANLSVNVNTLTTGSLRVTGASWFNDTVNIEKKVLTPINITHANPAMTSNSTTQYEATASNIAVAGSLTLNPYYAFDGLQDPSIGGDGSIGWRPGDNLYATDGSYLGSATTGTNLGTYNGEWLGLRLKNAVENYFVLTGIGGRTEYDYVSPGSIIVLGNNSTSGASWTVITTLGNVNFGDNVMTNYTFGNTTSYTNYRFVFPDKVPGDTEFETATFIVIHELKLYGEAYDLSFTTGTVISGNSLTTSNINTNSITAGSINITGGSSFGGLITASNIAVGNISTGALLVTGGSNFTGVMSASNLAIGNISVGNLILSGLTTGNINITGSSLLNSISAGGLLVTGSSSLIFNSNTIGNIITTGGNVGIGVVAPRTRLHLQGTDSSISGPHVTFTTSTDTTYPVFQVVPWTRDGIYLLFDEFVDNGIIKPTSTKTGFEISKSNNRLVINYMNGSTGSSSTPSVGIAIGSTGNVGIGLNTPAYKLDVLGTTNFSDLITASNLAIGNISVGNLRVSSLTAGTAMFNTGITGGSINMSAGSTFNIGITAGTINITGGSSFNGVITASNLAIGNISVSNINFAGGSTFSTLTVGSLLVSSGGLRAVFNSNTVGNLFTTDGNVGIGISTPAQRLEVGGALRLSTNPTVTNDNAAAYFWNQSGVGAAIAGYEFEVRTGGDTSRLRIASTGNVGIGTTAPHATLDVAGTFSNRGGTSSTRGYINVVPVATTQNSGYLEFFQGGFPTTRRGYIGFGDNDVDINIVGESDRHVDIKTNQSTRLRIGNNGTLRCNRTDDSGGNGVLQVKSSGTAKLQDGAAFQASNNGNWIIGFFNTDGAGRGQIAGVNATSVAYNTTSDRRLKKDVEPMPSMISKIKSLRPVNYNWVRDNASGDGFIAQEVFKIFPQMRLDFSSYCPCECGAEDLDGNPLGIGLHCECQECNPEEPVDVDGKPKYYGLDYGKFTPYIIKALQETIAENELLKTQLEETKTKVSKLEAEMAEVYTLIANLQANFVE